MLHVRGSRAKEIDFRESGNGCSKVESSGLLLEIEIECYRAAALQVEA